ncbi:MAG: DsbA family protein [Candidatus Moranbacteria bacterium]|nr:DsbA family protein [Candidatus Moranbacteria bacterium]
MDSQELKLKEKPALHFHQPISSNASLIAFAIILGAIIIAGAIALSKTATNIPQGNTAKEALAPSKPVDDQAPTGPVVVSTDNDPVLGDKNAPLTLIEFSDYECPFCKRSFTDVLPELKKTYIDTGKVKLVFRDYPLPFHANGQKEAEAAECARSLSDDDAYFKFHDQIFTKTKSNGTGLALTELPMIAKSLGLDVTQFQQCLDSDSFKEEVTKDIADGSAVGVSGTPSYFIGASSKDGKINGKILVGAQPFTAFKALIDEELKNLK